MYRTTWFGLHLDPGSTSTVGLKQSRFNRPVGRNLLIHRVHATVDRPDVVVAVGFDRSVIQPEEWAGSQTSSRGMHIWPTGLDGASGGYSFADIDKPEDFPIGLGHQHYLSLSSPLDFEYPVPLQITPIVSEEPPPDPMPWTFVFSVVAAPTMVIIDESPTLVYPEYEYGVSVNVYFSEY